MAASLNDSTQVVGSNDPRELRGGCCPGLDPSALHRAAIRTAGPCAWLSPPCSPSAAAAPSGPPDRRSRRLVWSLAARTCAAPVLRRPQLRRPTPSDPRAVGASKGYPRHADSERPGLPPDEPKELPGWLWAHAAARSHVCDRYVPGVRSRSFAVRKQGLWTPPSEARSVAPSAHSPRARGFISARDELHDCSPIGPSPAPPSSSASWRRPARQRAGTCTPPVGPEAGDGGDRGNACGVSQPENCPLTDGGFPAMAIAGAVECRVTASGARRRRDVVGAPHRSPPKRAAIPPDRPRC
jgi:hypothetical protein